MRAMFSGGIPGMPPGMNAMARRAAAKGSARGKKGKKKPVRSGDPRRAAEIARGAGAQGQAGQGGSQAAPAGLGAPGGLGGLGGLPEGFPENIADSLANLPSGLNFPPPSQGNIPAAFRGGTNKRRDKKK
jgi:hypothetical protein